MLTPSPSLCIILVKNIPITEKYIIVFIKFFYSSQLNDWCKFFNYLTIYIYNILGKDCLMDDGVPASSSQLCMIMYKK